MSQFLGFSIFLVIATGLILQAGVDLPWYLEWVGNLPGDLLIRKNGLIFYAPITTSVLTSAVVSFILSLFSGNRN